MQSSFHCSMLSDMTYNVFGGTLNLAQSITPLLKKPGLNTADMGYFRPVSNLTFISKVRERAVAR